MKSRYIILVLLFLSSIAHGQPVDTTISYQGKLDVSGMSAQGEFDFVAAIYDAPTLGNQIGPMVSAPSVMVSEGIVNLDLNFGAGVFNGERRYLELWVQESGARGELIVLEPRQLILAAPYSISAQQLGSDILQRGTVGDCTQNSAGASGVVPFPTEFSNTPIVFLTPDESGSGDGCTTVRVSTRSPTQFTYSAWIANDLWECDCIHWLAIGRP